MKGLLAIGAMLLAMKLAAQRITFDVVIVNTGKVDIDRSSIEFPKFRHKFGIVNARENGSDTATFSGAYKKWPLSLTVTWVDLGRPERAYRQQITLSPPMISNSDQPLELVVEIRNGKVCAYQRIYDPSKPATYRYQKDPPCDFASLKIAEEVPVPKMDDFR